MVAARRRLLILQCGKTKDPAPGLMPAWDRYTGPLWRALRRSDPGRERTQVAALSAKYGLIQGSRPIEAYDAELTDRSAAAMVAAGGGQLYPLLPPCEAKTEAGRARYMRQRAEMNLETPFVSMVLLERAAGGPFHEVCIVGGHRYVRVAQALMAEFQRMRLLVPDCRIEVINDEIGMMMKRMKEWVAA